MCGIFAYVKKDKLSQDDILVLISEFSKISHRGPDNCNWVIRPESNTVLDSESYIKNFSNININDKSTKMLKNQLNVFMGFHRLSINDISEKGNQPFYLNDITMICNGEIYNYKELRDEYDIELNSNSDCEIIIQLYKKIGFEATIKKLDGVFACVLYD
jgi:asparagine synthase (glutamine-hydrolysing)